MTATPSGSSSVDTVDSEDEAAVARVLAQIDGEALARDCLDFVAVRSETGDEAAGSAFLADLLERSGWPVALDEAAPGRRSEPAGPR